MQVLAVDIGESFEQNLTDAIELLPKIGYFLLILLIGYFVAKVIQKILTKVLQRVGFDQLVERGGVKKAMAKSKYDAAEILAKIVFYFIFLLVLAAAFGVFGADNPVSAFLSEIIAFLPNLFVAVLVIVIAAAAAAAVKEVVQSLLGGLSYGSMLANAASLFIVALGVFFALDQLQIAPAIVTGLFYALLALIVIPPIIAFGVGGIEPARETIVNMRGQAKGKAQEIKGEARSSGDDADEVPIAPAPTRRTRSTAATTTTRRRRVTPTAE